MDIKRSLEYRHNADGQVGWLTLSGTVHYTDAEDDGIKDQEKIYKEVLRKVMNFDEVRKEIDSGDRKYRELRAKVVGIKNIGDLLQLVMEMAAEQKR